MKKLNKLSISTLASFLLVSNIMMPLAYADMQTSTKDTTTKEENSKDTTPPTIDKDSFKVDTKEAKPGDTVTISLKAYDNVPGYFHHIVLMYYSPNISSNGKWKQVHLFDNPYTHECTGTVKIREFTDNGTWLCKSIAVCDASLNTTYLSSNDCDLSGLNVNVNNPNEDKEIPTIDYDSIKISKQNVNFGDTVNVSLKAHDDKSGIKEISVSFMKHGTGSTLYTCYYSSDIILSYNPKTDLYEASFEPNDENRLTPGEWILDRICFGDNAGNISTEFPKSNENLALNISPKPIEHTTITDLSMVANNYNKTSKDSGWNSKLDYNNDGIIDIYDITTVSSRM